MLNNTDHIDDATGHAEFVRFLAVSAMLTGFDTEVLRATGLADSYLSMLKSELDLAHLRTILAALEQCSGNAYAAGGPFAAETVEVARALTHLWYLGTWPGLSASTSRVVGLTGTDSASRPHLLSARGYAEGLVWKSFGGRPPGTWAPGFGSWERAPRRATAGSTR